VQRFFVGDGHVLGEPRSAQVRMLGPGTRIVEPRGNRMRFADQSVRLLQDARARTVEHAVASLRERRTMLSAVDAVPTRLDTDETNAVDPDETGEDPDRVRTAA